MQTNIERPTFPERETRRQPAIKHGPLDLAYRRIEHDVHDLDRLVEITTDLVRDHLLNPEDDRRAELAGTMIDVLMEKSTAFKGKYLGWYRSPESVEE